jgi:hypothetical protein
MFVRLFRCLFVILAGALEGLMYQAAAEQLLHLLHFDMGRGRYWPGRQSVLAGVLPIVWKELTVFKHGKFSSMIPFEGL